MTRRSTIWLVVASLTAVGNLGGAAIAAIDGEVMHAGAHVALALLGVVWALWAGTRDARRSQDGDATEVSEQNTEFTDRLSSIERSVDAVALEVERIGEGQRFMTQLVNERSAARGSGSGAPEAVAITAREALHD